MNAKSVKFYYDFISQPSRAMYIIMRMSEALFDAYPTLLTRGQHQTEEFKEINRFQKVPCIVHGDFKLAESIAILRYLHGIGSISESLYPSDLKKRARVDEYLEWQHHNTRLNGFLYFRYKFLRTAITGKNPIPEKLESLENHLNKSLDTIEDTWLDSNKFIVSDELTAADIFAACEIEQPRICAFDPCKHRPKLTNWLETVRHLTNPHYDHVHKACKDCCQELEETLKKQRSE